MKYIKILTNGKVIVSDFRQEDCTLAWLQKQVGGYIEAAPLSSEIWSKGFVMLVDEEGRLKERTAVNWTATRLTTEIIVGDALILKVDGEDFTGMEEEDAEFILTRLGGGKG